MSPAPRRPPTIGRRDPLDRLEARAGAFGVAIILVAAIVFGISWGASRGLPWRDYQRVSVLVPDAAQLVRGDEVRIGGARVGRLERIAPHTQDDGTVIARLDLQLDPGQGPLPVDSTVTVAPVNLFGNKYVDLVRGRSTTTVPDDGALTVDRARPMVELSDILADVDPTFAARVRRILDEAGTAFAGRGHEIAGLVDAATTLLPRLRRFSALMADPANRLESLLVRVDTTMGLLDDLRPVLPSLLDDATRVLAALDASGPALERTLARAPGLMATGATALREATPVLRDLRVVASRLAPVADRLPGTVAGAERLLAATDRTLSPATRIVETAAGGGRILRGLAAQRAPLERVLADLDLVNAPLQGVVRTLGDAQIHCGVAGLMGRNLPAAVNGGDRTGAWLSGLLFLDPDALLPAATQHGNLHVDPYPRADAGGCAAGNARYAEGRRVGPADADDTVLDIRAPAEATERARRAGLLDRHEGTDR
ncbi:MAG: MlaD family protein [Solirubrobacteraceae bacterium]|nr:MlaD family protein [Solirubrobacteraceae bacterium]